MFNINSGMLGALGVVGPAFLSWNEKAKTK